MRPAYEVLGLPIPPSSNGLFVNAWGNRRGKSLGYQAWIKEAGHLVNLAGKRVEGAVTVRITIHPGKGFNPNTSDLANREKALTDLLVSCGKIEDDKAKYLRAISLELGDSSPVACADVAVYSLEAVNP